MKRARSGAPHNHIIPMREKELLPLLSERLGIEDLNDMQRRMLGAASENRDIILLSPTGSGKTVAFMLPVCKALKTSTGRVQCVVIAPSRELVLQIAGVAKALAKDFKVTALYGGHSVEDEVNSLRAVPDIIVATPGRLLDHARRDNVDLTPVRILVLDEFDKCLELGFEEEMRKIVRRLKNVSRTYLTSATSMDVLPDFLNMEGATTISYLDKQEGVRRRQRVHRVDSDGKDKLQSLLTLLNNLPAERTIVFTNHRESAERTASFLEAQGVDCVLYHGALDQNEREKAIARFNNGSRSVLVATDLAARGLDIEHVSHIVHYHQPLTPEAYTHRNGRTARVDRSGDIYVLLGPEEDVKEFIDIDDTMELDPTHPVRPRSDLETLFIGEGRKEKLSRGDIAGFLIKEAGLAPEEVGKIDIMDHYALVAVPRAKAAEVVQCASAAKLKGKKRRVLIAK